MALQLNSCPHPCCSAICNMPAAQRQGTVGKAKQRKHEAKQGKQQGRQRKLVPTFLHRQRDKLTTMTSIWNSHILQRKRLFEAVSLLFTPIGQNVMNINPSIGHTSCDGEAGGFYDKNVIFWNQTHTFLNSTQILINSNSCTHWNSLLQSIHQHLQWLLG